MTKYRYYANESQHIVYIFIYQIQPDTKITVKYDSYINEM